MKNTYIVELKRAQTRAFSTFAAAASQPGGTSPDAASELAGLGIDVIDAVSVPLFGDGAFSTFATFASSNEAADMDADHTLLLVEAADRQLADLENADSVAKVWPNSQLSLYPGLSSSDVQGQEGTDSHGFSGGRVDCRPYRPGVSVESIRERLGVARVFGDGFFGQNVVVGIVDEGVDGSTYPVIGGYDAPDWPRPPGSAPITSHGSMCAADVLVAAPAARLYDYAFLGVPDAFGALKMFQAVLDQRRRDGTPQIVTNSWGFYGYPSKDASPNHEVWNAEHPLHRKIREVAASGAFILFAAGNCGAECAAGNCATQARGPNRSIHGSNALAEVLTVGAVNSRYERIGYSSQGPSLNTDGFEPDKPDVAAFSHFFGNFGPDRPGGTDQPFDNGTSAATPVAAGVAALLWSAFPQAAPAELRAALVRTAIDLGPLGFDHDHGFGAVHAGAAYAALADDGRFPPRITPTSKRQF